MIPRSQCSMGTVGNGRRQSETSAVQVAAGTVNGKRHSARRAMKREAVDALQRLRQAASDRDVRVSIPMWMEECLRQWLEAEQPGVKPSTYRHYELGVRRMIPYIGNLKLSRLTPGLIEQMYMAFRSPDYAFGRDHGPISEQTIFHQHAILRNVFRWAVRLEYLPRNPLDKVVTPRVKRHEMSTLNVTQIRQLFDTSGGRGGTACGACYPRPGCG